eukprot:Skav209502  [mRNA]  locus=scaffold2767:46194:46517:+ [translate_table: standard]
MGLSLLVQSSNCPESTVFALDFLHLGSMPPMRSCACLGFLMLLFAPLRLELAPLILDRAHIELFLLMQSLSKLDLTPLLSGLVKMGPAVLAPDNARLGFLLLLRSFA